MAFDIADKVKKLVQKKTERAELNDQVTALTKEINFMETDIIAYMESSNLRRLTTDVATVSFNEAPVPSIFDWDAFYEYVYANKAFHLLERRPAVKACRELFEMHGEEAIPGTTAHNRKTIGTRKPS